MLLVAWRGLLLYSAPAGLPFCYWLNSLVCRHGQKNDYQLLGAEFASPKLTTPDEVHEAIRDLKVSKAPGPNSIPNRALKYLPQWAVSLLAQIFNAVLTHHFPTAWRHARVISILKPGKDPPLPSSYQPISLMDTIGKLFEKILLARILHVVS